MEPNSNLARHLGQRAKSGRLDLDLFELDANADQLGKVSVHLVNTGNAPNKRCRADQVGFLHKLHPPPLQAESGAVEGAAFVRNQDNPVEPVNLGQKLQLIHDALLFDVRLRMTSNACGAAWQRETIVSRQAQPVLEKGIEVHPHPAVRAVHRRGTNSSVIVTDRTLKDGIIHAAYCTAVPSYTA